MARTDKRVFLGGSFDPPHIGHLLMAERAREVLKVERVDLLVTATPPHAKPKKSTANAAQRLAMAKLAIAGNRGLGVDERELQRKGRSYTIDTVRELLRERPGVRPVFIIGGDMLADLPTWKDVNTLVELADFAPVFRPGFGDEVFKGLRAKLGRDVAARLEKAVIEMPLLEISSTAIRSRIKAGLSVRYLVPDTVRAFIDRENLYGG
ncbi:MAG: nicotinate (nicotinamide) nucleotide adenylyltransferase [Planctomycetes bacterium]|nr:nicotinate (nicotinamide) nucleotide adenylyltransferase [Planctomycetota bacterium]